jgi:RimJ/RimL family protein N-acetyltransferase
VEAVSVNLTIRAFRPEESELLADFRRDPVNSALTYGAVLMPKSTAEVGRLLESGSSKDDLVWAWADEDDRLLGFSILSKVDGVNRTLWTGSAVFDARDRGRGIGTAGRRAVLDLVFNELGYRRIFGEFAVFNEASRRSHLKLGAEFTGGRRQAYFVSGRFYDSVLYTVSRERFNELAPVDPSRYLGRQTTDPSRSPQASERL